MTEVEQLAHYRKKTHKTYEKIAYEIGVSFRTVYRWINEGQTPHPFLRERIQKYLKNNP